MRIWPGSAADERRRARHPRVVALGGAVSALLLAAACGGGGSEDTASPANQPPGVKLISSGKLTTCTNLPYEPFQFKQGSKVVGFDVDLIDLVAKKLGVTQAIVDIDFDAIKSGTALNSGKCDVAAAGMTILPERQKNLDFSSPYFDEVLAVMDKKGAGVKSLEDVKAKNLKLGVQAATTSLDYAKSKGFDPRQYKDSGKQLLALQSGQVDVILQDLPVVNTWLKKPDIGSKFELGGIVSTGAKYGFAVKKGGNPELVKTINDTLAAAIKDGTWASTYQKWFGSAPASTPSPTG
jgi:polar amino acid transport system substrate-binding protein